MNQRIKRGFARATLFGAVIAIGSGGIGFAQARAGESTAPANPIPNPNRVEAPRSSALGERVLDPPEPASPRERGSPPEAANPREQGSPPEAASTRGTAEPPVPSKPVETPGTASPIDGAGSSPASKPSGASQPTETADASKEAGASADAGRVEAALVIEVRGSAERAASGVDVLASLGWTPLQVGDRLEPGIQIRTGLRSHVNLSFDGITIISIRSMGNVSIISSHRSATTQTIRIGLAYGTVRGGSTEGEVRSDVTVAAPTSALVKRGTQGWEYHVEAMTGRFRISLAEHGLVEAFKQLRSGKRVSRNVLPGQYATETNIANLWIKQAVFDRNVTFYRSEAVTLADAEFSAGHTRGYGTIAPGGGSSLRDVSARVNADFVLDQIERNSPASLPRPTTAILQAGPLSRPEGNFGTGGIFRVLVPQFARRSR